MSTKKNVKKITDFSVQTAPVKKKKEVPVSEQTDAIDVVQEWVVLHWKIVLALLIVLVLVISGIVITKYAMDSADRKAQHEIASASGISELTAVIEKHKGNIASVGAAQRLASLYLAEKDYDNAVKYLRFSADFPHADPFICTRAAIDCAGVMELKGAHDAAIQELVLIAKNVSLNEAQRAEAAYTAARIAFEAGNMAKAEECLGLINTARASAEMTDDPYSVWALDALSLKAKIAAKKTAAPAAKDVIVEKPAVPAKKR